MGTADFRWIYMPLWHESVIVVGRAVSPSLKINPILPVGRYPSSASLVEHGTLPKLGTNGRLATIRLGMSMRTSRSRHFPFAGGAIGDGP